MELEKFLARKIDEKSMMLIVGGIEDAELEEDDGDDGGGEEGLDGGSTRSRRYRTTCSGSDHDTRGTDSD